MTTTATIDVTFQVTVEGPDEDGRYEALDSGWLPRTLNGWREMAANERLDVANRALASAVVKHIEPTRPPAWEDARPGDVIDVRINGGEWERTVVKMDSDGDRFFDLGIAVRWHPWFFPHHAVHITDSRIVLRAGEVPGE